MHVASPPRAPVARTSPTSTLRTLLGLGFAPIAFVWTALRVASRRLQIALGLASILVMLLITLLVWQAHTQTPPGLVLGSLHIGNMTRSEALAAVSSASAAFNSQPVTMTYGTTSWQPTLAELGITVDTTRANALVDSQFGNRAWPRAVIQAFGVGSGPIVHPMPLAIDTIALETWCADRMRELGLAPVDAELKIDGQSIAITQDQSGYVVSINQVRADLLRELDGFTIPTINLAPTFTRASVEATALQPQLDALSASLSQPLVLYTDTDQWEVPPSELARHISIDSTSGKPTVLMDDTAITALIIQISGEVDHPVIDAGLDEQGRVPRIVRPRDGVMVNQPALRSAIVDAIKSNSHEVQIPVFTIPATSTIDQTLADLNITDVLATGTSDFSGSDNRREANIRLGARLIDGTLIAPGETFSFNQALGGITKRAGFVPAGATEGGIPGTSVGGGVCQVSTTVFRAALRAGLPIVEWWPHAFRSTFYEQGGWAPGFDASIQQDDTSTLTGADFKFTNTTSNWILISVEVSKDDNMTVTLTGTETGWDVEISDPLYSDIIPADQTPTYEMDNQLAPNQELLYQPARDGVTIDVHRTVYAADGSVLIDEDLVSSYQPEGPIYRVGPTS
ncbi:MAG TPA: VanW family protein [Thermomicrobiales bacterium]|nr:VanW family protein [Thermomicrobiales bacterium]HRA46593.1 VanW family protein [Thermomicrobiales bacterium]